MRYSLCIVVVSKNLEIGKVHLDLPSHANTGRWALVEANLLPHSRNHSWRHSWYLDWHRAVTTRVAPAMVRDRNHPRGHCIHVIRDIHTP